VTFRSRAPLRLGLAGGASDVSPYCDQFGGNVLNATIDLYAYCHLEPRNDGQIEFEAIDRGEIFSGPATGELGLNGELSLHRSVYNRVVHDFNDGKPLSLRLRTHSDAPMGSGLGASSTMVVAMLAAYAEWLKLPLGDYDIAQLAFQIERVDLGLAGGRQDQYAATFGGFNFIEFYGDNRVVVNPLRIKARVRQELETSMVLYYTGLSRQSANVIEDQINRVNRHDDQAIAATHELKKDAVLMKEAILKDNILEVARVLGRSWEAKKKIASLISNRAIDSVYEKALDAGAYSGKISGAGGGGFIIFMVDPTQKFQLCQALNCSPGRTFSFHFTEEGVHAWKA